MQLGGVFKLPQVIDTIVKASDKVEKIYIQHKNNQLNSSDIVDKVDSSGYTSPLTYADRESNRIIVDGLENIFPHTPIISEENTDSHDYETRCNYNYYWLIDPLDGTKEFLNKRDEFTVNIALIENGKPIVGLVTIPMTHELYYAYCGKSYYIKDYRDKKQLDNPILLSTYRNLLVQQDDRPFKIAVSHSHLNEKTLELVNKIRENINKDVEVVAYGSSLKMLKVATGEVDLYPRLGPTMEWDTAAADVILRNLGIGLIELKSQDWTSIAKMVVDRFHGKCDTSAEPLEYNKPDLLNPNFLSLWPI